VASLGEELCLEEAFLAFLAFLEVEVLAFLEEAFLGVAFLEVLSLEASFQVEEEASLAYLVVEGLLAWVAVAYLVVLALEDIP